MMNPVSLIANRGMWWSKMWRHQGLRSVLVEVEKKERAGVSRSAIGPGSIALGSHGRCAAALAKLHGTSSFGRVSAPSGSRSLTWPASPHDKTALAGQRHLPDRAVRGRTDRYLPRTMSFITPCATHASVPALQTPPSRSAARGNRPQAADIFVCLEAASTEIPGRRRPYGFHRCAAEPPSFLLPPPKVPAPWATGEGGSGCDERRTPGLCSTDQDGVALAGNSFFVGRCAAGAGSGSPGTMKSVKKTMCYAVLRVFDIRGSPEGDGPRKAQPPGAGTPDNLELRL